MYSLNPVLREFFTSYSHNEKGDKSMEFDAGRAHSFILGKFQEKGEFPQVMDKEILSSMVGAALTYDEAFMSETGVDQGEIYDDDKAFDYLESHLAAQFPDQKMYVLRFVEDYMDYNELYLESIGALEWE